jgi:enamine deaminase RidA (YjgF/YER057c/UK114 family)
MLKRYYITPENSYKVGGNKQVIYTPVIVVQDEGSHSHVYLAGRTSRTLDGDVASKGDMRGQIREVCIAIQVALESVGGCFADITRTTTYTTDMKAYFAAIDERFKYFTPPYPTSTLIGVACLAMPEMLVEIECEAIVETSRLIIPPDAVLAG